jgi:phenylalanine-4-hydroxylase
MSAKHGAAAGLDGAPERADWVVDQGWERYSAEEHRVWKTLFERQSALLPGRACDAFLRGVRDLAITADAIPDFRRLSDILMRRTGWQVVAVPGLLPDGVFFDHLANRRFPAGNFIRKPHELDYIEEPDVFHDLFGHVPMLVNESLAEYLRAYGVGGLRANRLGALANLARVYWFTVEFGLVAESAGLRFYGSGIASSFSETQFALDDPSPNRVRFDLARVMRTRYRIDDFQETYFVIDRFEDLLALAEIDFAPLYDRVKSQPDFDPGEIVPTDHVITRGTHAYHAGKRDRHRVADFR